MQKQDKYEIQYFLQMHGHIMYQHDITTSYQGSGTIFFIFILHKNYNLFKTIHQAINKLNQ